MEDTTGADESGITLTCAVNRNSALSKDKEIFRISCKMQKKFQESYETRRDQFEDYEFEINL